MDSEANSALDQSHLRPLLLPKGQQRHPSSPTRILFQEHDRRQRRPSFAATSSTVVSPARSTFDDSASVSTSATAVSPPILVDEYRDKQVEPPSSNMLGDYQEHSSKRESSLYLHATSGFPNPPPRSNSRLGDGAPPHHPDRSMIKLANRSTEKVHGSGQPHLLDPYRQMEGFRSRLRGEELVLRAEEYRRRLERSRSRDTDRRLSGEAAWDDQSAVDTLDWSANSTSLLRSVASTETYNTDEEDYRDNEALRTSSDDRTPRPPQLSHAPSAWNLRGKPVQRKPSRTSLQASTNVNATESSRGTGGDGDVDLSTSKTMSDDFEVSALRREVEQLRMALVQKALAEGNRKTSIEAQRPTVSVASSRAERESRMSTSVKPVPSDPLPPAPRVHHLDLRDDDGCAAVPAARDGYATQGPMSHPRDQGRARQYIDPYDVPAHHVYSSSPPDRYTQQELYGLYGHRPPPRHDYAAIDARLHRTASSQYRAYDSSRHHQGYAQGELHHHGGGARGAPVPPSYISAPPSTAWPDESVSQVGSEDARKVDELAKKVEVLEALLRAGSAPQSNDRGGGISQSMDQQRPQQQLHRQQGPQQRQQHEPQPQSTRISTSSSLAPSNASRSDVSGATSPFIYNATASGPAVSNLDLSSNSLAVPQGQQGKKKLTLSGMFKLSNASSPGEGAAEGPGVVEMKISTVSWSRKRTEKTQVPKAKLRQGPGRGRVYIAPAKT
ncbi:uncharacterized protein PFL1_00961 [Pseudozyma flocculosa PF-1]|uniref:Uncharacterized protein n=1 Tax=Pseudozyma flocculosa TaxID=84751 RepID=A0A5C3F8F9_9BASI|nr:uncharacterized protein PFL1_00961 [Pseudozyma flocculosa PF-1]EPQ31628.1 hypothetical protein PFL1_00961 [Pseudozyma flocculosa PF-1]SPO40743.1 uncharacterized protein PSFLO_06225 [Pseudozyma flocculosa]